MSRSVLPAFDISASVVTSLPVAFETHVFERSVSSTRQRTFWSVLAWTHSSAHSFVAQLLIPYRLDEASASAKTRP